MILSIGEILADMTGSAEGDGLALHAHCGGAPFNCAVNAKQAGAKVGFVGRVGCDPVGKFLQSYARRAQFDFLDIQTDKVRGTTLAFVTLTDGERDFSFFRHDTADYHIDLKHVDFSAFPDLHIVHLGSLMLSEEEGRALAQEVVQRTRKIGAKLSFDVNFRKDIYADFEDALKAYRPFVAEADILKFSEDELAEFTGIAEMDEAVATLNKPESLVVVTLGKRGCAYYYKGMHAAMPPAPDAGERVDTTGAGDAFFGSLLAHIDGKDLTRENIEYALMRANEAGARTVCFRGAVRL
ncbi:MAG TPA: carbohydrate kinase [Firmicutes bacterium]|nr:carbohydrate kinase [Bacillota bacterium]